MKPCLLLIGASFWISLCFRCLIYKMKVIYNFFPLLNGIIFARYLVSGTVKHSINVRLAVTIFIISFLVHGRYWRNYCKWLNERNLEPYQRLDVQFFSLFLHIQFSSSDRKYCLDYWFSVFGLKSVIKFIL